ncbi:calcium/sodium antiporter [Clostridium sp. LP20]|uniref:calcium/sodium antiporter n=1 Tax=Clostridium sp. LP20 TaxID=3418665 RepID=UPI003EE56841
MEYIILIVGFVLLIKGADIFVDGAAAIARKIGIPAVIVGLTIVSLGTSAPELAVSLISSIEGNNGITIGNVLGSNIFNSLVVLGGTTVVMPLIFKKSTIKRDFIINTGVAVLVFLLTFGLMTSDNNGLSRVDGIILLALCVAYVVILVSASKKESIKDEYQEEEGSILKKTILIIVGVLGIVIGGKLVVDSATSIAYSLGMSEKLVGLTIVAIGTSLPELVTSIVAALKGEKEIALGNVLGSNIFNILLILGASATIMPIPVGRPLAVDFLFFIGITLFIGLLIFFNKKEEKKLTRGEGILLILLYIAYVAYIIMRN